MVGTKTGGAKARETNYEKHGRDFYKRIGKRGGSVSTPTGGFGHKDNGKKFGAIGGKISRRGYKLIEKTPDLLVYKNNITGAIMEVKRNEMV